jgi:hypothetical protein
MPPLPRHPQKCAVTILWVAVSYFRPKCVKGDSLEAENYPCCLSPVQGSCRIRRRSIWIRKIACETCVKRGRLRLSVVSSWSQGRDEREGADQRETSPRRRCKSRSQFHGCSCYPRYRSSPPLRQPARPPSGRKFRGRLAPACGQAGSAAQASVDRSARRRFRTMSTRERQPMLAQSSVEKDQTHPDNVEWVITMQLDSTCRAKEGLCEAVVATMLLNP